MVTGALADFVVSACEIAVMVAFAGVDPVAGAVYNPLPSIVPSNPEPETDHVTAAEAENCFVPPRGTVALEGVIVNPVGGGGFELTDWHATINPIAAMHAHPRTTIKFFDRERLMIPKTAALVNGSNHGHQGGRLSALRGIAAPVPVFGPFVEINRETWVVPAPALIVAGLNAQVLSLSVESAGAKLQLKFTFAANVAALVGAAVKL